MASGGGFRLCARSPGSGRGCSPASRSSRRVTGACCAGCPCPPGCAHTSSAATAAAPAHPPASHQLRLSFTHTSLAWWVAIALLKRRTLSDIAASLVPDGGIQGRSCMQGSASEQALMGHPIPSRVSNTDSSRSGVCRPKIPASHLGGVCSEDQLDSLLTDGLVDLLRLDPVHLDQPLEGSVGGPSRLFYLWHHSRVLASKRFTTTVG